MIIVMRPGASDEDLSAVEARCREGGLDPHVIYGTERKVVAAVGDERGLTAENFSVLAGVEKVMPVLTPYKLASIEVHPERTVVATKPHASALYAPAVFGGTKVSVIAGPCTVESRHQVIEIAHAVKDAGASALRGGAFKPRTSPYAFQGLEREGLEYLAEARDLTGLPVVTEVVTPQDVPLVERYADVLQIGARNMQNYLLLKAVGETLRPVLLKRGLSATLEELLLAAEYVLRQGNQNVIVCERGIRTFERHTRNTLALSAVPSLHATSHLPVIVDPSHGTGYANLVMPMARAAVAAGADGLIVEVHPDPRKAMVDGGQSIDFPQFREMMKQVKAVAAAVGREA
jgi:3-deoxy-7-phosphoheptulonate synthase